MDRNDYNVAINKNTLDCWESQSETVAKPLQWFGCNVGLVVVCSSATVYVCNVYNIAFGACIAIA